MLHQIKAPQFDTDLALQKLLNPPVNGKIQGLIKALSDFSVLFKADLFFKDFSRKPSKFKYFLSLCQSWDSLRLLTGLSGLAPEA